MIRDGASSIVAWIGVDDEPRIDWFGIRTIFGWSWFDVIYASGEHPSVHRRFTDPREGT